MQENPLTLTAAKNTAHRFMHCVMFFTLHQRYIYIRLLPKLTLSLAFFRGPSVIFDGNINSLVLFPFSGTNKRAQALLFIPRRELISKAKATRGTCHFFLRPGTPMMTLAGAPSLQPFSFCESPAAKTAGARWMLHGRSVDWMHEFDITIRVSFSPGRVFYTYIYTAH